VDKAVIRFSADRSPRSIRERVDGLIPASSAVLRTDSRLSLLLTRVRGDALVTGRATYTVDDIDVPNVVLTAAAEAGLCFTVTAPDA
jgi:hypothetical protein